MTLDRKQVINTVEQILNIKVNEESINTDFEEWDSLGSVQLAAGLERELNIPIPDDVYFFSMKDIFKFYGI